MLPIRYEVKIIRVLTITRTRLRRDGLAATASELLSEAYRKYFLFGSLEDLKISALTPSRAASRVRPLPNSTRLSFWERTAWVRRMLRINVALALFSVGFLFNAYTQSEAPRANQPEPITNRYVDTKLCAGCHPGISRSYRQTGMGRSFYRPLPANSVEDYSNHNHYYHAASDTHYVMLRRGDQLYQRRYQIGY